MVNNLWNISTVVHVYSLYIIIYWAWELKGFLLLEYVIKNV